MASRLGALWAAAVLLCVLLPSGVGALTLTPDPRSYTNGTDTGSIDFIGDQVGGAGLTCLDSCPVGATDIVLIFEVSVTGGTLESLGVGLFDTAPFGGVAPTAAGWIPGGNADVTVVLSGSTYIFSFDAGNNGQLDPGETSDQFFVSYASVDVDGTQSSTFMVNGSTGPDFTVSSVITPEPAGVALLGVGVLGLAWRLRKRSA